jgi:uncharacterized protein (TIGR03437 family)
VALTFTGIITGANPASQTLAISTSNSVGPVQFTAAAATSSGGNWLTVTPTSGTSPATLTVSASLAGLAQGAYNGAITLTPASGGSPTTVLVTLNVNAQPAPGFMQVQNAASGATGTLAPGEIVSIFGTNLGPTTPAGLTLTAQGTVATTLAGVTVLFNGTPAPLTYVSATQINCVVPYEVATSPTAQVQVSYNGLISASTLVPVAATQPGIFTQNASGSGLGAITKADYSIITAANPAPRGSTIIIYATGGGQTTPASLTGQVPGSTLLFTNAPVSVTIGGIPATVAYAGSAPGLVAGVLQINAVVPATAAAGNQPIVVTTGSNSSQNNVQVVLQ